MRPNGSNWCTPAQIPWLARTRTGLPKPVVRRSRRKSRNRSCTETDTPDPPSFENCCTAADSTRTNRTRHARVQLYIDRSDWFAGRMDFDMHIGKRMPREQADPAALGVLHAGNIAVPKDLHAAIDHRADRLPPRVREF